MLNNHMADVAVILLKNPMAVPTSLQRKAGEETLVGSVLRGDDSPCASQCATSNSLSRYLIVCVCRRTNKPSCIFGH